jgi:hypothetical protein
MEPGVKDGPAVVVVEASSVVVVSASVVETVRISLESVLKVSVAEVKDSVRETSEVAEAVAVDDSTIEVAAVVVPKAICQN